MVSSDGGVIGDSYRHGRPCARGGRRDGAGRGPERVFSLGAAVVPARSGARDPPMPIRSALLLLACWTSLETAERAAAPVVERGLPYRAGPALSEYERERCVLDLYLPAGRAGFPTMVWFHGGGIIEGDKDGRSTVAMAERFAHDGVAVAGANYRLSPKVLFPAYVEDAAASVAWVAAHIQERGGDPKGIFIAGHSAGGYLAALAVMDPSYLAAAGVPAGAIAGLIPVSGQMIT